MKTYIYLFCLYFLFLSGCALKSGTYDPDVLPNPGVRFGERSIEEKNLEAIETNVIEVCSKKGCWVKLAPPEILKHTGFLLGRFTNSEFAPPSELKNKPVKIFGRYTRQRYSPATQKEILAEIGLGEMANQVGHQPVERMEFEIFQLEVL